MKKQINISARCVEGAKKSAKSAKKVVKKISLTAIVAGACANAGLSDLEAQAAQHKAAASSAEAQFSFDMQREAEIPNMLRQMNIAELTDFECREFLEDLYKMLD